MATSPEMSALASALLRADAGAVRGEPLISGEGAALAAASATRIADRLAALASVLARWFGTYGYHAVLARALATARLEHPVLADLRLGEPLAPELDGLGEAALRHGTTALQDGATALVAHLLELLGRVIGSDLLQGLVHPLVAGDDVRVHAPDRAGRGAMPAAAEAPEPAAHDVPVPRGPSP